MFETVEYDQYVIAKISIWNIDAGSREGKFLTLKAIKAICHHVDAGILQVRGNLRD